MKKLLIAFSLLFLSSTAPQMGEKLTSTKDQYTVLKRLNKGAYSEVFEVQGLNDESYALKWYKDVEALNLTEFHYLFGDWEREFEVGTALDHPSIIKAVDVWDHYLILEKAKGRALCSLRERSLTVSQAIHISLQLVDAMKYAFCHQLCNLKLQARNIFIQEDFRIKIVDLAYFVSFDDLEKHYEGTTDTEPHVVMVQHFEHLTDLCVQVIDKSVFPREERIAKKLAVKKIAWEIIEEYTMDEWIDFSIKFDLLVDVIKSFD